MGDLLPCPFCGGSNVRLQQNGYTKLPDGSRKPTWWECACDDCDFCGPGDDREKAIAHWNTRALPSATQAGGWMPPEDRKDGYRCLGFETLWSTVEWREGYWLALTENDDRLLVTPTAFAPLPPAPEDRG